MSPLSSSQRQTLLWAGLALLVAALLYSLAEVLTPFLLAAILAYILNPGVDRLVARRVPRALAVTLMITLLVLACLLLVLITVPVLQTEMVQLQQKFPLMLDKLNHTVAPKLREWFGLHIQFDASAVRKLVSDKWAEQDMLGTVLDSLKVGGLAVIGLIANALLVPMVLFYLLLDWHRLVARLENLIPRHWHAKTVEMVREIDALLAQFLRGQLLVMLILAIYYSVALAIAGFDVALPVGIFTGLLIFIPYLGFGIGLILATLAALLQFDTLYGLIAVAVIYGVAQLVESFYLTPRLVGERIGLHPLAVIFALLAFGQWFGFFGVLLALPVSAALLVGLRHLRALYLASPFYNKT